MCYFRTCQEQWVEQPRLRGRNQMQEPDWRAGTHSLGFGSTLNPALHRTVCPSTVQMRPGLHMNNEHQLPAACGQSPCSEIDHFLLSCKHALIFCTLKLADVSWIAYRLELLPFQSQGECSPDYNAHIYGWDLFFFFVLMLMISIFGTKLLLIMVSSHWKVKKAGSRRKLLLQQAHTALHLCGLKIKLSTPTYVWLYSVELPT